MTESRPSFSRPELRRTEYRPLEGHDRIRAQVTLAVPAGHTFVREADGTNTRQGHLQAGALACIRSAMAATGGRLTLTLRGVQTVPAFDGWAVLILLTARSDDGEYRLVGCSAPPGGDLVRGAGLAVLSASNRLLERYVDGSDGDGSNGYGEGTGRATPP